MSICINSRESSIECEREREASTIGGLCSECDKIQQMNPEDRAIARLLHVKATRNRFYGAFEGNQCHDAET